MSAFSTARQKMVDGQVRTNDVTDLRIIDAMAELPREEFVPENQRALAYLDRDLDVTSGGTKRFLIKPMLTAKLLQAAEIVNTDNVLIVGCATGYAAALAAKLAWKVTATESDAALVARGTEILNRLGLGGNVTFQVAEAAIGAPREAPYDVIMLNGATEMIPEQLYGQLKDGGRLVGVFATIRPSRAMIVTHSHHDFGNRALFDAAAPVLPGLEQRPAFVF
ncbi:protein-L-isoaspartate O-methyltransferase family protein [Bradyrhizobium sp.]|uniref:protein-L-isoaspartate O-methyltransferase family protein n=1 Tax=Bradyrhizobium sp. TaxID=376 RepID=UPI003C5EB51A